MSFPRSLLRRRAAVALGLAFACALGRAAEAAAPASMDRIVQARLVPQLEYLVDRVAAEGAAMQLDGVRVFEAGDEFLPGKIALGIADLAAIHGRTDPARAHRDAATFRRVADMTLGMTNHAWGIYYYLLALHELDEAGLLQEAVAPPTLERLRRQLDWRSFVRSDDLTLIDLPANYYGVALGVARLRHLLGWEDESASRRLLDRVLAHVREYSGPYGFSDETDGEGRFDRYSILLVAELCERLTETGLPVPAEVRAMLRRSVDIALAIANPRGEGFSFGRSLGAYGDTAPLEILTAAMALDVLSPDERPYAYAYASRIAARFADFWIDPAIHSVDLWNRGRRTDAYRGKHRILGENFSLLHQFLAADARWNAAGWRGREPAADLQAWVLRKRPAFDLTWFARGRYDRALALVRDGTTVFSLLMVNGGSGQHANAPYYPLPFAPGLVEGTPDSGPARAQLLPRLELADGTTLLPTAFLEDIRTDEAGGARSVSWRQHELARVGERRPQPDDRVAVETSYRFEPGRILRTDRFMPRVPLHLRRLSLDFASFSEDARPDGASAFRFGAGRVLSFAVTGAGDCEARAADADDRAPEGPMRSRLHCERRDFDLREPLTVTWTLGYRQEPGP
jgi:hypothetical protein